MLNNTALVVVDMQKYYLLKESDFYKYCTNKYPDSMDYIHNRCRNTVINNIINLINFFREKNLNIIYLKLCGKSKNRKDLHRYFRTSYNKGIKDGYSNVYPLRNDSMSQVIDELAPLKNDIIIHKTTFSPFSSTDIDKILKRNNIKLLVFTGLATSQCVETTARDASDHGYGIIHIENAQADYTNENHYCSLYSSSAVCGNWVLDADNFIKNYDEIICNIENSEFK